MKKNIEYTYGKALRGIFITINPIKKKIIKTHCIVHQYICIQGINILKNEGLEDQYNFYKKYIKSITAGAVWADQDFRSSSHFFHYEKEKGLYGFSNAMLEAQKYCRASILSLKMGDTDKAMFYLGIVCHLVQDVTVPQHVNNKLLKSHRNFELWIIDKILVDSSFDLKKGIKRYGTLEEYIRKNAKMANDTHMRYKDIKDRDEKYYKISKKILAEAQETTAGLLADFYDVIQECVKDRESYIDDIKIAR